MTTISEKILENIKEKHISPEPRWKFLAKNSVFWAMFCLALIIGALSFAFIVDVLVNNDWSVYLHLHKTFLQYIILSLPYIWIVFLAIFFWVAYFNFVHTRGWYHHRVYAVILIAMALSIGLGCLFVYCGINRKIDQVLNKNVPYYESLNHANELRLWDNPAQGVLGGEIMEITDEKAETFVIEDSKGNDWIISKSELKMEPSEIKVGEKVKIVGEKKDQQEFVAKEIRDWDTNQVRKHESQSNEDDDQASVKGAEDSKMIGTRSDRNADKDAGGAQDGSGER